MRLFSAYRLFCLLALMVVFSLVAPLFQPKQAEATAGILKQINFQGKVVNKTTGTNIANGDYSFTFRIYDVDTGGTHIWTETKTITVTNGIFQTLLGSATALPGSLDFNTQELYLGINFNSDGEMLPRVRFAAVPYAFNAEKVAGLTVTNTTGTLTIPNASTIAFSGANDVTFTSTGTTGVTLPTTGTLATLAGSEEFTNKTIGSTGLVFSGATNDITTVSNQHLAIMPNGSGNVGIGTTTPTEKLGIAGNATISGTLALGPIAPAAAGTCDASAKGKQYFDGETNKMYYCNGSVWTDMSGGGATPNFDDVYAKSITDGNLTMEVDNASGLTYDLTAGDFMIGSTGVFATFDNTGFFQLDNLKFDGNTISSVTSGGITLTPLSGQNLSVNLATTGDFIVNTDDLVVDTSSGNVGIGTTTPYALLNIVNGTITDSQPTYGSGLALDSSVATAGNIKLSPSVQWGGSTYLSGLESAVGITFRSYVTPVDDSANDGYLSFQGNNSFAGWTEDILVLTSDRRVGIGTTAPIGKLEIQQDANNFGALKGLVYTGVVNTNQTLSTEIPAVMFTTAGRQWATGAITTQREVLITQPVYSFVGGSTITNAATVGIAGAPNSSTNATLTNSHALLIQSADVTGTGAATYSYGLTVNAQTGAATGNYAAQFIGGNVGIGTATPTQVLGVAGNATISGTLALGPLATVDAGTCNAAAKGKQYMDGVTNKMYYCNGSSWIDMTGGAGGAALDTLTAATTNDTALLNADNSIIWEWAMTNANRRGVTLGESAAAINGVGNQFLLELTTDSGSTAGPLSIISNSADAGDIEFDLNSAGDFSILDAGTAYWTFGDDRNISYAGLNTAGITLTSSLTAADRSTGIFNITQANDTTYNFTSTTTGLLNITNSDSGSSAPLLSLIQNSSTAAGKGLYTNASNSNIGVDISTTLLAAGKGINVSTGGVSNPSNFSGDYVSINSTRTGNAAQTYTDSGNWLDISRSTTTIDTAGVTFNITGDLATFSSSNTETLGTITDTSNILELAQNCGTNVDCTGAVLNIVNAGTGQGILLTSSSTGVLATLNASGAGTTATGLVIANTAAGAITTGIDLSDAEIGDAINIGANPIVTGNVAGIIGDTTTDSWELKTDGTGDAEIVLPADSIGPTELNDNGVSLGAGQDEMCLTYEDSTGIFEWQTCGAGGAALDTLTAATTNDTALLNADNSIIWEWAMTNAARRGMTLGESTAATGGSGNQFLLELTTDAGSTAGPLSIISNSADAGDIEIDLNSAGDFLVMDGGAAFATFDDTGFFQLDNVKMDGTTISTLANSDLTIDALNTGNTSLINITNSDGTYGVDVEIEGGLYTYGTVEMVFSDSQRLLAANTSLTNGTLVDFSATNTSASQNTDALQIYLHNIDDASSETHRAIYIDIDDEDNVATDTVYGIEITNASSSNGNANAFLFLNNTAGNVEVPAAILIADNSAGSNIEYGIDASDPQINYSLFLGQNNILGSGSFALDAYNAGVDTTVSITNHSGSYVANLSVQGDLTVNGSEVFGSNGESLNIGGTDGQFLFKRDDVGTVTITANDNDTTAALNILPGGAAGLTLGGGSMTALTVSTDGTGDAEIALPNDAIATAEILDDTITATDLSATLTFAATDVVDLAAATNQGKGLVLPQGTATNPTNPAAGEGHVYWETDTETLRIFNGATWSTVGGSSNTFSNGLTESGGAVKLGGALTENTTITQDSAESLTFTNAGSANTIFNLTSTGDFVVNDGVSDLLKLNDDGTIDVVSAATTADAIDITLAGLTQGAGIDLNLDALTSGDGLRITSTATALTTGSLIDLLWNPATSERYSTGDLFKIDLGQYANPLNLFALYDNAVELFSVDQTKITSALPHEFTAAGDVSMAYDLVFTNQTASLIDSYGPLTISSGESFENQNLTLRAYGTGAVVLTASGLSLETGENLVLDSNDSGDSYIEHNNASNYISFFVDGTEEVRFLNTNSITTNNDITTAGDFDIAETYPTFDETLKPGDIVAVQSDNETGIPAVVEKADSTNESAIIGIVSTSPAISMGTGSFAGEFCSGVIANGVEWAVQAERDRLLELEAKVAIASASATATEAAGLAEEDKVIRATIDEVMVSKLAKAQTCLAAKQVIVTLAGRIPLRVSLENGPIKPGDPLALASVPGVAAKAIKPGPVVGKALEPYSAATPDGKIMVFANLTYYPGYSLAGSTATATPVNLANTNVPGNLFQQVAGALVITGDVSVTKTLFASDVYAAGSLSTGVVQIDGLDGSISTAQGDLRLQTGEAVGNVDIFNGLLVFTPDGGIVTQSDIMANRVKANELVILGAADNQENASIGSGSIVAGATTTTITNTSVKVGSKIFLTATSGTGGQSLVVENKLDGSFTVSLDHAHSSNITFDYWIVGVE